MRSFLKLEILGNKDCAANTRAMRTFREVFNVGYLTAVGYRTMRMVCAKIESFRVIKKLIEMKLHIYTLMAVRTSRIVCMRLTILGMSVKAINLTALMPSINAATVTEGLPLPGITVFVMLAFRLSSMTMSIA